MDIPGFVEIRQQPRRWSTPAIMNVRMRAGDVEYPLAHPYVYVTARMARRILRGGYMLKSAVARRGSTLTLVPHVDAREPRRAELGNPRRTRRTRRAQLGNPRRRIRDRWTVDLPPFGEPTGDHRRLNDRIVEEAEARPRHWNTLDALCGHCSELAEMDAPEAEWRTKALAKLSVHGTISTDVLRSLYTCGDEVEYTARAYNRLVNSTVAASAENGPRSTEYAALCQGYVRETTWDNYDFSADSDRSRWPSTLVDTALELFEQIRSSITIGRPSP